MLFAICLQELAVARSFPPLPESGEVPEDADTEAADSEATVEDEAEDEETDDANNFFIQPRTSSVAISVFTSSFRNTIAPRHLGANCTISTKQTVHCGL